jgi:acetyl-CoA synthetase
VSMVPGRDILWIDAIRAAEAKSIPDEVEFVDAEHPLFVLYTSGSTGSPKGVQHGTAGYMVYAATTFKYAFNYQPGDVWFCTADCGWITGHSYVTYGPLLNAATQVIFEGVPNYPDAGRLWEITDRYEVSALYTAPTAIRALKRAGDEFVTRHSRKSLKILGSVGEPINPEAYCWYFDVVGDGRCPIVDTWWQTETGGFCLTPLPIPGLDLKPGAAMMPFFGIEPALLDEAGQELEGPASGYLVIKSPWPATLRSIYGDHKRMEDVYFNRFPGYYMTGDGARRDEDGHYYLTGRVDDVLNVSGHRMGTAEVESALVLHKTVVEAAVVGVPHEIKGEDIYAYVTLISGLEPSDALKASLKAHVRKEIGPIATPGTIHWAPALPKTRSGKIMRRLLRIIAKNGKATTRDELGDTSTLADESVVSLLIEAHGL